MEHTIEYREEEHQQRTQRENPSTWRLYFVSSRERWRRRRRRRFFRCFFPSSSSVFAFVTTCFNSFVWRVRH